MQTSRSSRHSRRRQDRLKTSHAHSFPHCSTRVDFSSVSIARFGTSEQVPIDITILTTFYLYFCFKIVFCLILFA